MNETFGVPIKIIVSKKTHTRIISKCRKVKWHRKMDNWGGGIFIYSCLHALTTIDFKIV